MSIASEAVNFLRENRVQLSAGLTRRELARTECRYGFAFSEDHAELLRIAVPVGEGWLDWRSDSVQEVTRRLRWPIESALFDVERNNYWHETWGTRPADTVAALALAANGLASWPQLIPINGHRYIPAAPTVQHPPVFSVYQTDVIVVGLDLLDYADRDFGSTRHPFPPDWQPLPELGPWGELAIDV